MKEKEGYNGELMETTRCSTVDEPSLETTVL